MKKTIKLFGPGFPRYHLQTSKSETDGEKLVSTELAGLVLSAKDIGDVLQQYSQAIRASIRPYDGSLEWLPLDPEEEPKFFILESYNAEIRSGIIDVHIERDGQTICGKQNIAFELMNEDTVVIGLPAC